MKRVVLLSIALALCLSFTFNVFAEGALTNFSKTQNYQAGQFTDVDETSWYAEGVKNAYELGLVKGSSSTTFSPSGNVSIAEVITLAARIHSIYMADNMNFVQGNVWYQVYVDYATKNGIISAEKFNNFTAKATRAQFAEILYASLPESEFNSINSISQIPDVSSTDAYANAVLKLYNAGILTGSDKYGTFNPKSNIQRSEMATIVTRIACPALRKTFTLEKKPPAVTGIELAGKTILEIGQSTTWTAKVLPEGAVSTLTWTAGNPSVATVDQNGKITALKSGTCNITVAANNNIKKSVIMTVVKKSYSTNGYYNSVRVVPDYGIISGLEPIKVVENKYGCTYYYPVSTDRNIVDKYSKALTSAGFKIFRVDEENNVIVLEKLTRSGADYFVRIGFEFEGNTAYFFVDASKSPI